MALGAELFRRIEGPVEVAVRRETEAEHEQQVVALIRRIERLMAREGPPNGCN